MEPTYSSSKVTVEYYDPSGLYQLLTPGFLPRLPLRNLHWESHSGPLRSISSLHIDLIPSNLELSPLSTTDLAFASIPDVSRVKSEGPTASADDGFRVQPVGQEGAERPDSRSGVPKSAVKERRHQIPGLRQTPYLKVLLLRCDDNDTYKASACRQVREWIRDHVPASQSTTKLNSQENHDAFEWLVIHVVVPNTAAATQPRISGKSSDGTTGSATQKTGGRWRSGASSTILEKLRADFNSTGKNAIDRISQIRIGVNDVPYDMLPRVVPAIPGSYTESAQDNEAAWVDLISKFKSLILSSFDMRVTQYEEDIKEKDSQRTLPGWNFCTFFMLKEGLARGFESVGLVEDALVGYDELAIGLDAIIAEQSSSGPAAEHGGTFLPYTEDLKLVVERAKASAVKEMEDEDYVAESDTPINLQSTGKGAQSELDQIPLNATKKRYRDLILSSNISIFDFRCYLFARQLSLLLRRANASSSQAELLAKLKELRESTLKGVAARMPASPFSEDVEDLSVLGEICRKSMDFIASISRVMRDDILASQEPSHSTSGEEKITPLMDSLLNHVTDNVVSSFTFSIAQQILAQTSTKSLPIPPSSLAPSGTIEIDGQEPKAAIPEPKTMMHPARSSSLAIRSRSREPSSPTMLSSRRASVSERDRSSVSSRFLKPGLEELAAQRAALYLLSRNLLEQVGSRRDWSIGWAETTNLQTKSGFDMEEVNLDDEASGGKAVPTGPVKVPFSLHGIDNKLFRLALKNKDDYYRLYETLTDKALRHYTVANYTQAMQTCMADLAVLKYHLTDYAAAASYFYRMTPFYGEGGWTEIELTMLVMYAKCLKQLQRKEEYVRVVLKLLSKTAIIEKERISRASSFKLSHSNGYQSAEISPIEAYVDELFEITRSLPSEVRIPMQNFFGRMDVEGTALYLPGQDSFELQIQLRYLLAENMTFAKVEVKITSVGEGLREIWLENLEPVLFQQGLVTLRVRSNTIIPGTYLVTHVKLSTNNVSLNYEDGPRESPLDMDNTFLRCPKLLIYQQADAFDVRLSTSKYMHLTRNRSMEIELSSGWNEVQHGQLLARPATAGLRLQTSEVEVVSGSLDLTKNSEPGMVRFGAMAKASSVKLRMPFNLEHEVNDVTLKLEISYTTEKGNFIFATTLNISITLPLGVNVQDMFKHKALFSRFTISSATNSPLRLLGSRLEGSETFSADCGLSLTKPVVIFPRQPASMLYKITRKHPRSTKSQPRTPLSLILNYSSLEEEIDAAVTQSLQTTLADTELNGYARLIIPTVLEELHIRITSYDLERTAILSEVSTAMLSGVRWRDCFYGLGRSKQDGSDIPNRLAESIQQWQRKNTIISLIPFTISESALANSRSIAIPVEVPSVTVVHTANLEFNSESSLLPDSIIMASNQPISATLAIKWTRIWDAEPQSELIAHHEHLDFVYEVSGAHDTWLIGGRRKGHFKIPTSGADSSTQNLLFPVMLIPLREGFLPYPTIDVKVAPIHKLAQADVSGTPGSTVKPPIITCETDFQNAAETLRVVSDARKTTVSLDASGPQGGAWLLESERRSEGQIAGS